MNCRSTRFSEEKLLIDGSRKQRNPVPGITLRGSEMLWQMDEAGEFTAHDVPKALVGFFSQLVMSSFLYRRRKFEIDFILSCFKQFTRSLTLLLINEDLLL